MLDQLKNYLRDEEGQDLVEYALLLVFIALAAITVSQRWVVQSAMSLVNLPARWEAHRTSSLWQVGASLRRLATFWGFCHGFSLGSLWFFGGLKSWSPTTPFSPSA